MDEHNNQNVYGEIEEKGNFGWAILGFFFPIIGLILYIVWKGEKPKDSKYAGVGALVSVICRALLIVLYIGIFYFALWPAAQGELVQQTCSTYGEDYVAEKRGDNWGCRNTITNEYINPDYSKSEENDNGENISSDEVESLNYEQTLKSENIDTQDLNYEETDNQITIYLFRGQGCIHCKEFLEFMHSITSDYGKNFKLVSFEIWNNQANNELLQKVSDCLNEPSQGVPYIVIGDKVFVGYTETYNDQIKKAIEDLYKVDKSKRYDAFDKCDIYRGVNE